MRKRWDFPGGPVVGFRASTAGGARSIPGRGTKIPSCRMAWSPKEKKKKKRKEKRRKNEKEGLTTCYELNWVSHKRCV